MDISEVMEEDSAPSTVDDVVSETAEEAENVAVKEEPLSLLVELSALLAAITSSDPAQMEIRLSETFATISKTLSIDMRITLLASQSILVCLQELYSRQNTALTDGGSQKPITCEEVQEEEEDMFAAVLKILGGVFYLVAPEGLDELVMVAFSEIEGLDAGLADEKCLVPMHEICVLLLTAPTPEPLAVINQETVPASPSNTIAASTTVSTYTSSSGSSGSSEGSNKLRDNKRIAHDLEDNFVKLFKYLLPRVPGDRLPSVDRIRAVFDEVATTCGVNREMAVRACEVTYDSLQVMCDLDLKAEKGRAGMRKYTRDRTYVSVLVQLFPYLSEGEMVNNLSELRRVTCKLGVPSEFREVPIKLFCDLLDRRLRL
jgi:hypothetical protein